METTRGEGFGKEPDSSYRPFGPVVRRMPTIVLEVALYNESVRRLVKYLENYVTCIDGPEYALGIKLYASDNYSRIQVKI